MRRWLIQFNQFQDSSALLIVYLQSLSSFPWTNQSNLGNRICSSGRKLSVIHATFVILGQNRPPYAAFRHIKYTQFSLLSSNFELTIGNCSYPGLCLEVYRANPSDPPTPTPQFAQLGPTEARYTDAGAGISWEPCNIDHVDLLETGLAVETLVGGPAPPTIEPTAGSGCPAR